MKMEQTKCSETSAHFIVRGKKFFPLLPPMKMEKTVFRKGGTKNSDAGESPKSKNVTKFLFMASEQGEGQNHNVHVRIKSFEYVAN
jgi:hypothetical protein